MKKLIFYAVISFITLSVNSQNSFYDYSFNSTGFYIKTFELPASSMALSTVVQDDGKILVAGIRQLNYTIFVARFEPDGSPDQNFGTNGILTIENEGPYAQSNMDIKVFPDGKIIITTSRTIEPDDDIVLIKLNSDGSFDDTFGISGISDIDLGGDEYINNIILNDDGSFFISGYQWVEMENESEFLLAKITEDGLLDVSFGNSGYILTEFDPILQLWDHSLAGIKLQNGNLILAGTSYGSGLNFSTLACYNPDGSLNSSFGDNGLLKYQAETDVNENFSENIFDIKETADNKLIVVGSTEIDGLVCNYVKSFNSDGTINENFGNNGINLYSTINSGNDHQKCEITSDNKILVLFDYSDTITNKYRIFGLNSDGSTDIEFGENGLISVEGVSATNFCLSANRIVCVGNVLNENFGSFYVARHIGSEMVSGMVYFDENQDQILSAGEQGIAQNIVNVEPGPYYINTNNSGNFSFSGDLGTYSFTYLPIENWELTTSPASYEISIADESDVFTGLNFGIYPTVNISDVASDMVGTATRAGFETYSWLNYQNNGTMTSQGTIRLEYDPLLTLIESEPVFFSHSDNVIIWEYDTLAPLESRSIFLRFQVPGVEYLDDTLISFCSITPIDEDALSENNIDTISQIITASYDPNDKIVTPRGIGDEGFVLHNSQLNYTIRFQNTGTDTAFNIIVVDTLNANLNIEMFRFISSSHPCTISFKYLSDGKTVLSFAFNNILLPHDDINEPGSHGFLKFSIYPKESLPDNTVVNNTAYIYFDFNPPIVTNEVVNTFTSIITGIEEISENINIYPNPTSGKINIVSDDIQNVAVFSIDGRLVKSFENAVDADLSDLQNGVYLIVVETSFKKTRTKVIKQ